MNKLQHDDIIYYDDMETLLLLTNEILSEYYKDGINLNLDTINNNMNNDTYMTIKWFNNNTNTNIELTFNNLEFILSHIYYFLFDIDRLNNLTDDYKNKLCKLEPHLILDIIFSKPLNNPVVLFENLKLNKNIIYQVFVLFLNKTISKTTEIKNISIVDIINDFVKDSNIDLAPFVKIILLYLREKSMTPITINYKSYNILK